jgi:hypothetical protein
MEPRLKETIARSECESIAAELEKMSGQMKDEDSSSSNDWAWTLDRIISGLRGLFVEEEILSAKEKEYRAEVDAAIDEYQQVTGNAQKLRDELTRQPHDDYHRVYEAATKRCDERIKIAEKKRGESHD